MRFTSVFKFLRNILYFFFGSTLLVAIIYKYLPVYITPLMVIRCVEQVYNGETISMKHKWIPLNEMSPYMSLAVISSEDQNYEKHNGFDMDAIEQAIQEHKQRNRNRGASTISQQTAKNVFLWPQSSWIRKGFETYFTIVIEFLWGKERIMEVYLNSIETGNGIYGIEAVAQQHFNTTAENLSKQQCALIAATLPNPRKFNSKNPSNYMIKRQGWILRQMRYFKKFPSEIE